MNHWQPKLHVLTVCSVLACLAALSGCAGAPTYYTGDRLAIEPTQPLALPALPDAELVVGPRGAEFAGYTPAEVDALIRYAIIAQANTEIAEANAEAVSALNAEAAARNDTAESMEAALAAQDRQQWYERIGWIGALVLFGALAL